MRSRLRAPSPAFVISLIALFVALGGTTYAATSLPKNSVGTKQLEKNAVTGPKIKNEAVTAAKINAKGLTVPNALHATSADSATNAATATNASHATSADLLGGLKSQDVAWIQGGDTGVLSLPNAKGTWTTVAKTSFTIAAKSSWVMSAQDNISFSGSSAAKAALRFLVNGAVDDDLVFPSSLSPSSTQGIAGLLKCNGMPAGTYSIEVQVNVNTTASSGTFTSDVGSLAIQGTGE